MFVKNILSSEKGLEKVMGDVIRVLWLYKRLWLLEIYSEIGGMNSSLNEDTPSYKDVVKAVEELGKRGIVKVDKQIRSSLATSKGVEDMLVTLIINEELMKEIAGDQKLHKYLRLREELFRSHKG
ncbi:MAG: hypothetical protein J7J82_04470 [Staphylothermus sp.]|nr:hypothetical protein [Staphylothermus sp.]